MSYIGSKPANKPVVASDLDPTVITGQTALAVAPADTDEFLISDAGTLKRLDASLIGSQDYVKLASGSFSSNSLSFDGYFTSAYSHYKIILTDVIPSTNNPFIQIRYRQGDSDITTSHYNNVGQYGSLQIGGGTSNGTSHSENGSAMNFHQGYAVSNASNACLNSELTIFNPLNTSLYKHYHYSSSCFYSGTTSGVNGYWITEFGGGYYHNNTTALSGFTIFASTGNITSGNVYLYGVKV